jgi:CRP-like cAMP-binding protein
MIIYKKTYSKIEFLKYRSSNFVSWICPLLKSILIQQGSYIFYENDPIEEIYFLCEGSAGFVLPFRRNIVYVEIEEGDEFGHSDIFEAASELDHECEEMEAIIETMNGKQQMKRSFTV